MKKFLLTAIAALASVVGINAQAGFLKSNPAFNEAKAKASIVAPRMAAAADGESGQAWWGYVQDNSYRFGLGNGSTGTFSQCVMISRNNSAVVGKTIKAVRFYLRSTSDIQDVKVWMATSLPASADRANVHVQDVDISTLVGGDEGDTYNGMLNEVEFTKPYTMTTRNLYVGYTFTVTSTAASSGQYPIVLADDAATAGSLYLKLGSGAWENGESYGPLALKVLLEGDFDENAVQPSAPGDVYAALGSTTTVSLPVTIMGTAAISSIDYTITAAGNVGAETHLDLPQPLSGYGVSGTVDIPMDADAVVGTAERTLTITKVNGQANEAAANSVTFNLLTLSKIVTRGIAIEEYTGTGCGWCPRGLIGMEKMRKEFGDAFVGIGIHNYNSSDPMYIAAYNQVSFSGAPSCRMNRGAEIDPYYGSGNDIFDDFRAALAVPAKAGLKVSGEWNADSTKISAKAEIDPVIDGEYAIEYVLIADGLTGTTNAWKQSNYYTQYSPSQLPPDMQHLPSLGSSYFTTFNDVAIAVAKQAQTTAPGKLTTGNAVTNTYTISMPTNKTLLAAIAKENVAVVALLIDKSNNTIANAAKFYMPVYTPEPQQEVLDVTIDHKRAISQGYGASVAEVDFTEAKAFLGVDELTTDMLRIENPDGELISDYAPFDGWFNTKGVAETWGDLNAEAEAADKAGICVKFFQAITNGTFEVCDMNGADIVDKTYTVKWQLVNGLKAVRYTINVTFTRPESVDMDVVDKGIVTSVKYDITEVDYVMKTAAISDDDVAAICQELGISDLAEATAYGYNPTTKELVKNHAPFDGWRDANGDFHMWDANGAVAPACVKIVDGATTDNGKTYYCYNRAGQSAQTIKCYWALANAEKAVLVEIDFIYSGIDDAEPAVPEGWEQLIANGNLAGDDVSSFFKVEPGTGLQPATITDGIGKNGGRGILVQSQDNPANPWDTQFFVRANKMLAPGTKVHMEFDYKASKEANISSQGHGEPTAYVNNDGVGTITATTEWQRLSKDFTINGNVQTIAFNLAELGEATDYVFDNIVFWAEEQAEVEWADIIVNGDMEGTEVVNFFSKEANGAVLPSQIFDGMGKDGSRGIKVESAAGASQDWDTQFWIYLPAVLAEGTKYKVEFDYRSDVAGSADTQAHGEPGAYIHWQMIGSPNFTTDWQHYEASGVITADQAEAKTDGVPNGNKFRSVAFNLSKDKANTVKFFFDNVKFFVDKAWVETGIVNVSREQRNGETIYNLRGQKVENPTKGLYIINGKKVVIK